ncbi:MAG: T9SS type A sorting domain-containing protein, partial [Taibaiella sp.]|nr:T9SS type A sorting domain-containing protein [Taibaiella sp.]
TVCGNSNNTYSNTFTGGTWSAINGAGSIGASGTFHANDTGSVKDTIYYTYTNGFGTTTVRKIIYIRFSPPRIVISPITAVLVIGNPYTLVATPTGGTWTSLRPTHVALTTGINFTPLLPGKADLIYTYSNVCGSAIDTLHLLVPGVDNVNTINGNTEALNVYPNPNSGTFVVDLSSAFNETAHIVVTNLLGAVVKEFDATTNKSTQISLGQSKGFYFLTATSAHIKLSAKVTVVE